MSLPAIPAPKYCRVGDGALEASIYRPVGVQHRYIMAFGDSGTSASAGPVQSLDAALSENGQADSSKVHFSLSYSTATSIHRFMPFRSLPQPNQAAHAVFREEPISVVNRPLGDEGQKITLSTQGSDESEESSD